MSKKHRSSRGSASQRPRPRPAPVRSTVRLRAGRFGILVGVAALVLFSLGTFAVGGGASPSPTPPPSAATSDSPAPTLSLTPPLSPSPSEPPASASHAPGGGEPISGVQCDPGEQLVYHLHAHLTIRIRGVAEVVPAGIGLLQTCVYWLHTHADSGLIHIEAPEQQPFTLGQFFDIWGRELDRSRIGQTMAEPGEAVRGFVDGVSWSGDPRSIELLDHRTIELQLGPEPEEPLLYTFPPEY